MAALQDHEEKENQYNPHQFPVFTSSVISNELHVMDVPSVSAA